MSMKNQVLLAFGNELNFWSSNLFYKILGRERVNGLFLPSFSLDSSFYTISSPDLIKMHLHNRMVIASRVYPKWRKIEDLKEVAERLYFFSENKFVGLSFTFLNMGTLLLLVEKLKDLIQQLGHIELNLVPAFFMLDMKARDRFLFRFTDALSESMNILQTDSLKIYVKIPLDWMRSDYLKALQDSGVDTVIVSLHSVASYNGIPYFLHSPFLSRLFLEKISLLKLINDDFALNYGFSIDLDGIESLDNIPKTVSILQLDLNLLLGDSSIQYVLPKLKIEKISSITFDDKLQDMNFKAKIDNIGCDRCKNAYLCKEICPNDAIYIKNNIPFVNPNKCNACGLCIALCPQEAIKWVRLIVPD